MTFVQIDHAPGQGVLSPPAAGGGSRAYHLLQDRGLLARHVPLRAGDHRGALGQLFGGFGHRGGPGEKGPIGRGHHGALCVTALQRAGECRRHHNGGHQEASLVLRHRLDPAEGRVRDGGCGRSADAGPDVREEGGSVGHLRAGHHVRPLPLRRGPGGDQSDL
ncbi:unnamed protein product, partial [Effrenium voratum]